MIFSGPSLRLLCLITLTVLCVVMGACGRKEKVSGDEAEVRVEPEVAADLTSEALNYADSLLATMSLEERIGQCFMPAIYSSSDSLTMRQLRRYISDFHVGGVV
ncbi:MAG: hypothetical protein K2G69_09510, partial [Muribaculaceae bacterium]|nr:hypothetical protein [Muribaculaceae bacterium]